MQAKQRKETELQAMLKAAADEARQAKWEFHNSILSMKEAVGHSLVPTVTRLNPLATRKSLSASAPAARLR